MSTSASQNQTAAGFVYVLANPQGQRKVGFASKLIKRSADIARLPWAEDGNGVGRGCD